jgi:ribosomal protein S18 acetylase RimI-like enzyme
MLIRERRRLLHALRATIWQREVVEISGRVVSDQLIKMRQMEYPSDIECAVVESAEELEAFKISPACRDSSERLTKRLSEGCVVFFAIRRRETTAPHEVLGYCLTQRGVFSALGRKTRLASDIFFTHHIEVLPDYRGHGIVKALLKAEYEYCETHGLRKTVTVRSPLNRLSVDAIQQDILGKFEKISMLRGLIVWHTPRRKVEMAIAGLGEG